MLQDDRGKHWKGIIGENNEDKGEVQYLMWEVYMKEKQYLINSGV